MIIKVSDPTVIDRKFYFVNECVEWALTKYLWTGCVDVQLRDEIMSNASELIRQIIRKQGLHTIYPGQEESSFGDLLNVAWVQLEKTLYKYRACPHCRRCFKYDRPSESLLYKPQPREYGIVHIDEITNRVRTCPKCRTILLSEPIIEPKQGTYGGSETILYRGMSKVFNMWCVAPDAILSTDQGSMTIEEAIDDDIKMVAGLTGMSKIIASLKKPEQGTIIVRTELNYQIECSPEHKLYKSSKFGPEWCEVGNLKIGDKLGIMDDDGVSWDSVVSLSVSRNRLCEISVDSADHSYIANGFVSHNSQVSRTVILAYIKKEARDRKNSGSYIFHLSNKSKPLDDVVVRFISEARDICQYNDDYIKIIDSLEWLINNDERPHDGIIGKLIDHSGLSRVIITSFMKFIKLRSLEFTDSPISRGISEHVVERHEKHDFDNEEE